MLLSGGVKTPGKRNDKRCCRESIPCCNSHARCKRSACFSAEPRSPLLLLSLRSSVSVFANTANGTGWGTTALCKLPYSNLHARPFLAKRWRGRNIGQSQTTSLPRCIWYHRRPIVAAHRPCSVPSRFWLACVAPRAFALIGLLFIGMYISGWCTSFSS